MGVKRDLHVLTKLTDFQHYFVINTFFEQYVVDECEGHGCLDECILLIFVVVVRYIASNEIGVDVFKLLVMMDYGKYVGIQEFIEVFVG